MNTWIDALTRVTRKQQQRQLYLHEHTSTYNIGKAFLRTKITSEGNEVTLTIICHDQASWIIFYEMYVDIKGTQREYSTKPLKHSIVERILVFKR